MYKIVKKVDLAYTQCMFVVEAERIAKVVMPGQFVIVRMNEKAERIPLTVCDYDREKGTITIVIKEIGVSTKMICALKEGDSFLDVVGPLGNASELCNMTKEELEQKNILFVAGGVGAAPVYPQVKYLSEMGIVSDVIIGSATKSMLILEDDFKKLNCNLYICTDDESYAFKGNVNNVLNGLCDGTLSNARYIDKDETVRIGKSIYGNIGKKTYDYCVAIGPAIMMKFVCITTKELGIPTIVSMNTLMVDGTGMCGACRIMVGDELKFCCVDGPEFDGHKIDFDACMKRQIQYKDEEGRALLKYNEGNTHHGGCGNCNG